MDINFILILSVFLAYLIGSLNFAIIISKILKLQDPKTHGSKNAGATNMARVSGAKYGVIVLLGDAFKAIIPLLFCQHVLGFSGPELVYVGVSVVIGHLFPIYFNFKGGKGIATGFGMILVLSPIIALCLVAIFALTLVTTRYVSLSSIFAAFFMPILSLLLISDKLNEPSMIALIILGLLLIVMHHQNIKNIFNNTEKKAW